MRGILISLVACVVGCGVTASTDNLVTPEPPHEAPFDTAACADALAKQAEIANASPALKASELLDGILTFGLETGIPKEFAAKVRSVCPAIGAHPAGDISDDQVRAIRQVK